MKRGWIFLILLIIFSTNAFAAIVFNGTIPDIKLNSGINSNVIDLKNYFFTNDSVTYKYKAGQFGLTGLNVEIDSEGRVDFTPSNSNIKSIIFIADDDVNAVESNDVSLAVQGQISEISFSPNSETLNMTVGETKNFAVSTSQSVEWHLDNLKLNFTGNTYQFTGEIVKVYELKAKVANLEKKWFISVLEENILTVPADVPEVQQTESVCGNGIREDNENCSSCPSDVQCSENADCQNGLCVPNGKNIFSSSTLFLWISLFAAIIIFVVVLIVLIKKKDLISKLFKKPKKIEDKVKENESKASIIQEKPHESDNLEPLIDYFKKNLFNFNKQMLIQEALKQGWTQEQIDKAFSQIGNENGQNQGNKETSGRKL